MHLVLATVFFLFLCCGTRALADGEASVLASGRHLAEAFLHDDISAIWRQLDPEFRRKLGRPETLSKLENEVARTYGSEIRIEVETTDTRGDLRVYTRRSRWSRTDALLAMQWTFDAGGQVSGFFVRVVPELAPTRFQDYETKADLRRPFAGEWFVYWGGRSLEQNYHAADRGQRFATDFVVRKNGRTHSGNALNLGSYFCWGKPILATAVGTVVSVVDGLPDQAIGATDPRNPAGNHVVMNLGSGEFVFLAHLMQGSVKVDAGQTVARGEGVGRCGNSGNTSEPHLHLHIQTTANLPKRRGASGILRRLPGGWCAGRARRARERPNTYVRWTLVERRDRGVWLICHTGGETAWGAQPSSRESRYDLESCSRYGTDADLLPG